VADPDSPTACHPVFKWVEKIMREGQAALGVPSALNYTSLNLDDTKDFHSNGDKCVRIRSLGRPAG
jgi:hypothetical protein